MYKEYNMKNKLHHFQKEIYTQNSKYINLNNLELLKQSY